MTLFCAGNKSTPITMCKINGLQNIIIKDENEHLYTVIMKNVYIQIQQ